MLKPLGEALGGWEPQKRAHREREPHELLAAAWSEIVGEEVARNSRPLRIAGDALVIVTRSSAWSQQLSFFSEHILEAARARLPQTPIAAVRFRVGKVAGAASQAVPASRPVRSERPPPRPAAATADEAIARFRSDVDERRRAKRSAGWKECRGCGALIAPRGHALCVTCANARAQQREAAAVRLLFEAPWLGFAGTAELIDGLTRREYESIRARLLARWWERLARALAAKRLSRDGCERLIASSYVVLKSKLPPEEIEPATVRNVLGDELHDLIYGTERQTKTNVE